MAIEKIKIPDLGGTTDVEVIEILVVPGDKIEKETSLIALEGDKASMEVPAPVAGVVKKIEVKVGDKVKEGDVIMSVETMDNVVEKKPKAATANSQPQSVAKSTPSVSSSQTSQEIKIPDLGGSKDVDVIEILVKPGDKVNKDDSLLTLEGDKASMDMPAPHAGTIESIKTKVGAKVNTGDLVLIMKTVAETAEPKKAEVAAISTPEEVKQPEPIVTSEKPLTTVGAQIHAGPAVRRLAREFGVELKEVKPSGSKDRILKEDVQAYVKNILANKPSGSVLGGLAVASAPIIDFAKFGEIESKPLSKIKRLTGVNTHRSWVTVPHVTQFDEADITELERFRESNKAKAEKQGVKLTPIVFLMKAVTRCLQEFPNFNSSLDATGENLILKKYFNIGVAVDTPNGLVVPVIREVERKGLFELAKELSDISKKAREKGLTLNEMQGSCFTISSLGGIGGTAFTPIVNAPDVAILGVSKAQMKLIYQQGEFVPRLMLPLSLSYDHRVIDGAEAARFTTLLSGLLVDIRGLLL